MAECSEEEEMRDRINVKAIYTLISALDENLYESIKSFDLAKKMVDTLEDLFLRS